MRVEPDWTQSSAAWALASSASCVVQVVGRDERQPQVTGEADEVALGAALDLEAVVHQLDVDVVGPKMSRSSPATSRASSYIPKRSFVWISLDGQPVVTMRPLP